MKSKLFNRMRWQKFEPQTFWPFLRKYSTSKLCRVAVSFHYMSSTLVVLHASSSNQSWHIKIIFFKMEHKHNNTAPSLSYTHIYKSTIFATRQLTISIHQQVSSQQHTQSRRESKKNQWIFLFFTSLHLQNFMDKDFSVSVQLSVS